MSSRIRNLMLAGAVAIVGLLAVSFVLLDPDDSVATGSDAHPVNGESSKRIEVDEHSAESDGGDAPETSESIPETSGHETAAEVDG